MLCGAVGRCVSVCIVASRDTCYRPLAEDAFSDSGDGVGGGGGGGGTDEVGSEVGGRESVQHDHSEGGPGPLPALEPVRIIHKEQDSIAAFCINKVGGGGAALRCLLIIRLIKLIICLTSHEKYLYLIMSAPI